MLTVVTPMQTSAARQRTQVYVWTAIIFVVYSILIALFKMKNRGTLRRLNCRLALLICYRRLSLLVAVLKSSLIVLQIFTMIALVYQSRTIIYICETARIKKVKKRVCKLMIQRNKI